MLPSVDEVLSQKEIEELIEKYPRSSVLESLREVIDKNRQTLVALKTEEEAEKFSLTIEKVIEETERKKRLTGAEDVLVVNNNAAAVMLVLSTMAKGGEAIVSRGELVEVGGSFRIPSVMALSGADLVEI